MPRDGDEVEQLIAVKGLRIASQQPGRGRFQTVFRCPTELSGSQTVL